MFKLPQIKIIISLIIINFLSAGLGAGPRISLQAEYGEDTIDYNNNNKRFTREKISLTFKKKSSFNCSHVYIFNDSANRYTWNLSLMDISPYFESILGHYYLHFGSGLMVGKKNPFNPDIFSLPLIISRNRSFSPCNSGNPLFSFHGITAGITASCTHASFSVHCFYSVRERYITDSYYDQGATRGSISSINDKILPDYKSREPVVIHDFGSLLSAKLFNCITLQLYIIAGGLMKPGGNSLIWNYHMRYGVPCGDKNYIGYGIFSEYSDDNISLFCEIGISNRTIGSSNKKISDLRDYGCLFGFRFKHQYFHISFTGKITGKTFYSPYSSDAGRAENIWLASITIIPLKKLLLGGSFLSEKKISPSYNESYLRFRRKEEGSLQFKFTKEGCVSLIVNHIESLTDSERVKNVQAKTILEFPIKKKYISMQLSSTMQDREHSKLSASLSSSLSILFCKYFGLKLKYSWFYSSVFNSIFANESSLHDTVSTGFHIESTSHLITGKLTFFRKESKLTFKYLHQFTKDQTLKSRIEVMGRLVF